MNYETPTRPAGEANDGRHPGRGAGESAPLQGRAYFLQNRDWASVTAVNRGLCARGGAQHGPNQEAYEAVARDWEDWRKSELRFEELLDLLRECHQRAPFLFFNGNTFGEIGRTLATAVFADLAIVRRKEASSAVAHYITGVLDRDLMVTVLRDLGQSAHFVQGARVRSLRGSLHGVITRLLDDGRVAFRADGASSDIISLPENLLPED